MIAAHPTLLADDGGLHQIDPDGPYFGSSFDGAIATRGFPDSELDGLPSAIAEGDDSDDNDQALVRTWHMPALAKFTSVCVLTSALLLASYQLFIRYTPIGTLLNGPRKHRTWSWSSRAARVRRRIRSRKNWASPHFLHISCITITTVKLCWRVGALSVVSVRVSQWLSSNVPRLMNCRRRSDNKNCQTA